MTQPFHVRTTPHFDRLLRKLVKKHPRLVDSYAEATSILSADPHNHSRQHDIIKLEGAKHGEGHYRLALGRWRFRYDIADREVVLHYCGLRREDTYRRRK